MFSTLTATTPFLLTRPPVRGSVAAGGVLGRDLGLGDVDVGDEVSTRAGGVADGGFAARSRVAAIPTPLPTRATAATAATAV
jgi:hypothetical protein